MKCSRFEHDLALWVEGDLPPGPARRLEEHLAVCEACQEVAENLRASQAALKDSHAEIAEGDLDLVRRRVLARIRGERAPRRRFGWMYAGAAGLAAAAAVWALLPKLPDPAPPRPPLVRPAAPIVVRSQPARVRPRAPSGPLLVKLYTDDPEVVIYWLIEKKGD